MKLIKVIPKRTATNKWFPWQHRKVSLNRTQLKLFEPLNWLDSNECLIEKMFLDSIKPCRLKVKSNNNLNFNRLLYLSFSAKVKYIQLDAKWLDLDMVRSWAIATFWA